MTSQESEHDKADLPNERRQWLNKTLGHYVPSEEEKSVIRSALFNCIAMGSIGAAALGMSAYMWANAGRRRKGIPVIVGTASGLALGSVLGMDRGMRKLRNELPPESYLRHVILENDRRRDAETAEVLQEAQDKNR